MQSRHTGILSELVLGLTVFCGAGCFSSGIKQEMEELHPLPEVQVSKAEPPAPCRALGTVAGERTKLLAEPDQSYESAIDNLRQEARKKGANYVVMDSVDARRNYLILARAFFCPAQPGPGAPPTDLGPRPPAGTS